MVRRRRVFGALIVLAAVAGPARDAGAAVGVVDTVATDASGPSISGDGRWVVFGGTTGDHRSVLRYDRATGATLDLSPVPGGARPGDTVHPRISADGCVVAANTQIAYDLFRDDDRGDRWDVYRLVVPECGGQPAGWELVSTSAGTGTSRDDVLPDSPPTVSGSGALVAFAHPAPGAPAGVSTISVVDLTIPPSAPGRVQEVAGMPVEAPNGAFLYHGAREPALSQNGRHLAFVSDATAADPLPGWAEGPVRGADATSQVYVWDRGAPDQRRAVQLVSGHDGVPSTAGGEDPDLSEDGRIVVFTSADRTLVPAELPACKETCPTQVYRFDRDTDGNGIFDEPPRQPPMTLASAIGAGTPATDMPSTDAPIAGDDSSWAPAVSADGSQVAFVTDATNLLPSRRAGGGAETDGDLLVAEHELGEVRRVLDGSDVAEVPGAHGHPALSRTGQVVAFDTMAAAALPGVQPATSGPNRNVVTVDVRPQLSLAALDFGTTLLGFESAELFATVLNAGPAAFEPGDVVVDPPGNFRVTGGTCARGVIVAAGASCSVKLTFNPSEPRAFEATLTVGSAVPFGPSVATTVRGAAGEPTLQVNPGGVDLPATVVGEASGTMAVDVENTGFAPTSVSGITIGGAHPDDFQVTDQSCTDRALNPAATCTVAVQFLPHDGGYRSALLIVATPSGQYASAVLGGLATYQPVFGADVSAARPGAEIGVGGRGFPPSVPVAIGFAGGGAPFGTVTTSEDGAFLAIVRLPARLRPGAQQLVATGPPGAVAAAPLTVLGAAHRAPTVPGYGLG